MKTSFKDKPFLYKLEFVMAYAIVTAILTAIIGSIPLRWLGMFQPLPADARSSNLSQRAVSEGHDRLANDLYGLARAACIVVRAEILSEEILVLGFGDTFRYYDQFSSYQLLVHEVYKGDVEIGDVIEVLQFRRLRGQSLLVRIATEQPDCIDYIRLPFRAGDELILFLNLRESSNSALAGISASVGSNFFSSPFFSPRP